MTFEEWKKQLHVHEAHVRRARESLESVESRRDKFLEGTVGFASRGVATLSGTVEMISKIIDMKAVKK